jgi:protein-L-isoaspartate(D-aspartate) O-methyltransferase
VRAARISGVSDERVLAAVARVPRSGFVADEYVDDADQDSPLPIGHGQTTSQPSLIAAMVECLDIGPDDTVLEVGSGYGYQTALLSLLARYVYSVEIIEDLAIHAQRNLEAFGAANVDVVVGDGSLGLPEFAPYNAIIVCAAFPEIPPPLAEQLAERGRIVQPIGPGGFERVVVFEKHEGILESLGMLTPASFVRLMGKYGNH